MAVSSVAWLTRGRAPGWRRSFATPATWCRTTGRSSRRCHPAESLMSLGVFIGLRRCPPAECPPFPALARHSVAFPCSLAPSPSIQSRRYCNRLGFRVATCRCQAAPGPKSHQVSCAACLSQRVGCRAAAGHAPGAPGGPLSAALPRARAPGARRARRGRRQCCTGGLMARCSAGSEWAPRRETGPPDRRRGRVPAARSPPGGARACCRKALFWAFGGSADCAGSAGAGHRLEPDTLELGFACLSSCAWAFRAAFCALAFSCVSAALFCQVRTARSHVLPSNSAHTSCPLTLLDSVGHSVLSDTVN